MCDLKQEIKLHHNITNQNIPQDITPKDDAFHGSKKHIAAEWWYFDAIFLNNYSVHIGCRTFSKKKFGSVMPFLEIYKDGKLKFDGKKRYRFKHFRTSEEFPLVKIFNNSIIEFDQDRFKKTGEWAYKISLNFENYGADLYFIATTKGFKIETKAESWTVALPKAKVSGEINLNKKKLNVNGIGYHDHNWNYTFLTALNYGKAWYWGKIRSKNINIVWANIVKSAKKSEKVGVVNLDNKGYYNINPENISFKTNRIKRINRKKTPTFFTLQIDENVNNIPIHADIKMEAKEFQYDRVLIAPYWRYHIKSTGVISVGNQKEKVDDFEIMEFLSFS